MELDIVARKEPALVLKIENMNDSGLKTSLNLGVSTLYYAIRNIANIYFFSMNLE